jgi:hypothetical protein
MVRGILFLSICFASIARADSTLAHSPNFLPLYVNAGYRLPINQSSFINSGHGLYAESGINGGYFLKEKKMFSLIGGMALKDKLWATAFKRQFIDDLLLMHSAEELLSGDSAIVSGFKRSLKEGQTGAVGSCRTNSFHTYSWYYGIVFSLPVGHYATTLKLYRGTTRSGATIDKGITAESEAYYEIRRKMSGIEVSLFPGFRLRLSKKDADVPVISRIGMVSFYYERANFSDAVLYYSDNDTDQRIRFSEFVSSSFLRKYKNENTLGIKVSWRIY